jgi:dihydroneopterin aldolase
MDIIFIRELHIETVIGVYPWERDLHRTLRLDLELGADIRRGGGDRPTGGYASITRRWRERIQRLRRGQLISSWWKPWRSGWLNCCCGNSRCPGYG